MYYLHEYVAGVHETLSALPLKRAEQVVDALDYARRSGQQVFVLGNGGSAAMASHFACDLSKGTAVPGQPRFRALSLADNASLLSAWANDTAYEHVFSEQLDNLMNPGDVVIGISCSGASPNVLNAMSLARRRGAVTIGFTGGSGRPLADLSDVCVSVPSNQPQPVEDVHLILEHAITGALRRRSSQDAGPSDREAAQPAGESGGRPAAIFLDRDGVINRNRPDHVLRWDDFAFLPGVFEAVWDLSRDGHRLIVVSNQAAVGRGLASPAEIDAIHVRMRREFERRGARIDDVFYCPHHPDAGCGCRKPMPGLLQQAAEKHGLDLSTSYVVGDGAGDVLAALAVGAHPLLVLTGRGPEEREVLRARGVTGHQVVRDLQAAAEAIMSAPNQDSRRTAVFLAAEASAGCGARDKRP